MLYVVINKNNYWSQINNNSVEIDECTSIVPWFK